ncbi:MAG: caspase family protein [Armatimonadetes bacterium]|nr:caspase family protein [Armatimonadota bacterium]MBX3110229.1 caspase family protein [Fimbriimonadaceae bacterium]
MTLTTLLSFAILSRSAPTPAKAVPAPAAASTTYALIYGVGNYPNFVNAAGETVVNALHGPPNDTDDMRKLVTRDYGVPGSNTRLRLNSNATADTLIADLKWVVSKVKPGDTFFFYFSGHGIQLKNAAEPDGLDEGIVLSGGRFVVDDDIRGLREAFNNAGVNVVFIFDSCFSGGLSRGPFEGFFRGQGVRFSNRLMTEKNSARRPTRRAIGGESHPKALPKQQLTANGKGYGLMLEASGENQSSVEVEDENGKLPARGIFTWVFAETVRQNPSASLGAVMKAILKEFDEEGISDMQRPQYETFNRDATGSPLRTLLKPQTTANRLQ